MFKIKNYKKINFTLMCFYSVFSMLVSPTVFAHEMWIEPSQYTIGVGDTLFANEKVGRKFKGNNYSYLDSSFESLNITVGDRTRAVKSRMGDLPAIQEKTSEEGLHIITARTTASELIYENSERFTNFLNEDGLNWVLAEHKKRGLPEKGFKEIYYRNPKTLVKVGHGKGQDRPLGMQFEWVVENNPYTSKNNITAQLLWQGKPAVNMHVNIFNKPKHTSKTSEMIKTSLITDMNGKVEIPRAKGGLFLINSVKMIQPNKKTMQETGAVWESVWASLSYEILLNI